MSKTQSQKGLNSLLYQVMSIFKFLQYLWEQLLFICRALFLLIYVYFLWQSKDDRIISYEIQTSHYQNPQDPLMSFHSPQDKSSNYLHLSLCGPLLICLPLLSPLSLFSPVYTLQFIQIFLNYLKTMIMPITIFSLPSNCSSFTTTHLHMIFTAPHFNLMNSSSHLS